MHPTLIAFRRLRQQQPDNLPMYAKFTRDSKGVYIADVYFVVTGNFYGTEIIEAGSKRAAMKKLKRMFPKLQLKRRRRK